MNTNTDTDRISHMMFDASATVDPIIAGIGIVLVLWSLGQIGAWMWPGTRGQDDGDGDEAVADADQEAADEGDEPVPAENPVPDQRHNLTWVEKGIVILSAIHLLQWYRRRRRQ